MLNTVTHAKKYFFSEIEKTIKFETKLVHSRRAKLKKFSYKRNVYWKSLLFVREPVFKDN